MRHFIFVSLFLLACTAQAQIFSYGVKAGVPVTAALPGFGSSANPYLDTGRWTIGPSVELHLFRGFFVEFDALFRGYTVVSEFPALTPSNTDLLESARSSTKVWDFPLLLKYHLPGQGLRPFLDAGYQWSHQSTDAFTSTEALSASGCFASGATFCELGFSISGFKYGSNLRGPAAGVGIEFKYRRFRIAPEVRYTRLSPDTNLVTILAGFLF
ncbi:MAG TPA: outer membrane beta-barrel protein [Bryobacteraceae bacterium]|nr:outer membrane beta-barrel protein [Bryobacteraceae bacterium]